MEQIVLDREEVYDPQQLNVWCFKHVDDIVESVKLDLGNMVSSYPFNVNGTKWRSSEELYLCGEFSDNTAEHLSIQRELISAKSPYAAKRFVKRKYLNFVRNDFPSFRTQWMFWVVWQKCRNNVDFQHKLRSIPNDVILVEETTTDRGGSGAIWGCSNHELVKIRKTREEELKSKYINLKKKERDLAINIELNSIRNVGTFRGQNNIGKILMICHHCLISNMEPPIDYALLESKKIHILGSPIQFK